MGLLPHTGEVRALIFVAQGGDWRLWPWPGRLAMFALWHLLLPAVAKALGHVPGWAGIGEDLPAGVAQEWARWCRRRGHLAGGEDHGRRALFARLEVPLLSYWMTDDGYALQRAVEVLLALYSRCAIERRRAVPREVGARHRALWALQTRIRGVAVAPRRRVARGGRALINRRAGPWRTPSLARRRSPAGARTSARSR